jgi:CRP-like cAMP-binding protein
MSFTIVKIEVDIEGGNVFEQYREYMQRYVELTDEKWSMIEPKLTIKRYEKGDTILNMGEVEESMRFLNRGLARAYFLDEEGREYTWGIFFNDANSQMTNLFVVDYASFINQSESQLAIEAVETCEFVVLNKNDLASINLNTEENCTFAKQMANQAYTALQNYIIYRQKYSAKQRYVEFVKRAPHLLDKVPQYQLASLLGITPQHLSRLKKEVEGEIYDT